MTAGPRDIIAVQVEAWERDGGSYADAADQVLNALAELGYAVVPAKPAGVEWGCRRTARWGGTIAGPMWKAEALSFAASAGPDVVECVVRRSTYASGWEPAPTPAGPEGPGEVIRDVAERYFAI